MARFRGRRVVVVGTTGSGKTTFAGRLARRLDVPHIELDALHWEPDWQEAPLDVFRQRAAATTTGECWVVDGNYGKVRDIVWGRADTLVWLDYPLPVVFFRLLRRTVGRLITGRELWNGNRERLQDVLTRDNLFFWALKAHPRHRREYPDRLQSEFAHLHVVRLQSPRSAQRWLAEVVAR